AMTPCSAARSRATSRRTNYRFASRACCPVISPHVSPAKTSMRSRTATAPSSSPRCSVERRHELYRADPPRQCPFTPLQRAWLDGYLAALFGDGATALPVTRTEATIAVPPPGAQLPAPQDVPWHDPALPLDERLALAAGQPIERQLMAAMGQLDCGQW